jgi:ubiquinol-cytochrome c reductase cytochrome b subunit
MPAYGNALNPSETKALVSFLMTLRGSQDLNPAIDSSRNLTRTDESPTPSSPLLQKAP